MERNPQPKQEVSGEVVVVVVVLVSGSDGGGTVLKCIGGRG